jgi:hypothetical protein
MKYIGASQIERDTQVGEDAAFLEPGRGERSALVVAVRLTLGISRTCRGSRRIKRPARWTGEMRAGGSTSR